jgi:hypothetical protein
MQIPPPGEQFEADTEDEDSAGFSDGPESIRDLQRRRRKEARVRSDIQTLLATPMDEDGDDEDQGPNPNSPPPARVFVVFQGAKWDDPEGGLRESDTIVGIYATESIAKKTADELTRNSLDRAEAWYQPYKVED